MRLGQLWLAVLAVASVAARATVPDPFALYDGRDGATCGSFNAGGQLAWHHAMGDWRDADGVKQGPRPFATKSVRVGAKPPSVEWDVTSLLRAEITRGKTRASMLLAALDKSAGTVVFWSREAPAVESRPQLLVELAGGSRLELVAAADATLDCSTAYALGTRPDVVVGSGSRGVLEFDLSSLGGSSIRRAVLRLTASAARDAPTRIAVFELDGVRGPPREEQIVGLAARYPRDRGIGTDRDVVFATDFESSHWRSEWSYVSESSHADTVSRDDANRFEPLLGRALRTTIPAGSTLGLDMGFDFKDKLGYEPEEIYFRYYLRFGEDWNPVVDGGKLPGLSGTYERVGWGGRRADPMKGWSMRGHFNRAPSPGQPDARASSPSARMRTTPTWKTSMAITGTGCAMRAACSHRNRWYCVEQYFRVNTPGARDGVMRAWIDGGLAFDKSDIRVRETTTLKIERVWMNVYHGGTKPTDRPLDLYIDNVVVAKAPIGCMRRE